MTPSKRNTLILAAVAAIAAYLFFQADNFWGLVISSLIVVWALIGMLPIMDGAWRTKVGFVVAVFLGSLVALWPTFEGMSDGKIKCPAYVKERITFGVVKGLDLQGGLRLVYTVEVEEAIRDKRDKFADEMRHELAVAYNFHTGEGLLKREELTKLEEKVHVSAPEAAVVKIKFKDPST
jgi:preprotein translocase subunit SecD